MRKSKGEDQEWMRTIVSSGTVSDKTAALTLQIQEAPIYRLKVKFRKQTYLPVDFGYLVVFGRKKEPKRKFDVY